MVPRHANVKGSVPAAHFAFQAKLSGHQTCDLMLSNCTSWDEEGERENEGKKKGKELYNPAIKADKM